MNQKSRLKTTFFLDFLIYEIRFAGLGWYAI